MRTDDGALVTAVVAGRTDLYAELVERHSAAVFRLVRSAVPQSADAEDIAQEAFLAGYRSLARLREPGRFRAWLLSIASRKIADHLRKKHRRGHVLSLDVEPPAPPPSTDRALVAAVEAVVERLPPGARLIFALRHHEGLSCRQIAQMLDVAVGTVYSRLSRTHAVIRQAMGVVDR